MAVLTHKDILLALLMALIATTLLISLTSILDYLLGCSMVVYTTGERASCILGEGMGYDGFYEIL